jgi:hypothetical protein
MARMLATLRETAMIHQIVSGISDLILSTKPWVVIAVTGLIGVAIWIEKFDEEATVWSTLSLAGRRDDAARAGQGGRLRQARSPLQT